MEQETTEKTQNKSISKFKLVTTTISVLLLLLISSFFAKNWDKLYFEDSKFLMNTDYCIKAYGVRGFLGMKAAFRKIEEFEKQTSFYLSGSPVNTLNQKGKYTFNFNNKQGRDLLREIAMGAKYMYENTDGYFDPSFALYHELYGFHSIDKKGRQPSEDELKSAFLKVGFTQSLHFEKNGLSLNEGSMVDFGGIVGGYSIVTAKAILEAAGCKAFLIDDSGDIWFQGEKPDKSPWKVGVKDPRGGSFLALIESKTPLAISTSGNYERFVTVNGKKYGHIIDPKTGKPADYYQSVTVVTLDPIQSDVLSTALFAMPPEKAYDWVEMKNIAALFLDKNNKITLSTKGKLYFTDIKVQ